MNVNGLDVSIYDLGNENHTVAEVEVQEERVKRESSNGVKPNRFNF